MYVMYKVKNFSMPFLIVLIKAVAQLWLLSVVFSLFQISKKVSFKHVIINCIQPTIYSIRLRRSAIPLHTLN